MTEQIVSFTVMVLIAIVVIATASICIPCYGFIRRRWKGLAIGCLMQPIVCLAACVLALLGIIFYHNHEIKKHQQAAMIVVKNVNDDGSILTWFLKGNEECLSQYQANERDELDFRDYKKMKLHDIVPLDSCRFEIDDRLIVRIDQKKRKVTATDFGKAIEVVDVDWQKVDDFLKTQATPEK